MQRNISSLIGYNMGATDGEIGKVDDFYFDDKNWSVRYLVIKTGGWLSERKVLVSTQALLKNELVKKDFPVNLTKKQIENSPDIDTEKPISRQQEIELYQHYAWQRYGGNGFYAGESPLSGERLPPNINAKHMSEDLHLRSTNTVTGYHIRTIDGEIGHINDFIIDDKSWQILFVIVDTHDWIGGKKVLIGVGSIKEILWEESKVILAISTAAVKDCTLFDESKYNHAETAGLSVAKS